MYNITKETILQILADLILDSSRNILLVDIIESIIIRPGKIGIIINISEQPDIDQKHWQTKCEKLIKEKLNINEITIIFTGDEIAKPKIKAREVKSIKGVKQIIVIASCKGGVGKSTITANLAKSLAAKNYKVGILDADIYGPSIAQLFNNKNQPQTLDNKLIPLSDLEIKFISMGNLISEEKAAIWRGPMITKTLSQLFLATNWGELDILLVDTPPGTGDIHLSLLENFKIDGVIMVSTPQQLSLLDVKKSIDMYRKMSANIIGIVENMSYFLDSTGHKNYIFGKNRVEQIASEYEIDYLGEVPILPGVNHSEQTEINGLNFIENENFLAISEKILEKLKII